MPFTPEQQAIIDCDAPRICAAAFAGTGKTTCCVGYAQARTGKVLYLAYNKAIQLAARQRFPSHVICKTTHALAFPTVGRLYSHKLGNLRKGDIASLLRVSFAQAGMVADTLTNYLCSADRAIELKHLPPETDTKNFLELETVLAGAKTLWSRMQNVDDDDVPMMHDGYLKLFSLTEPVLQFDYVIFDESQDANPVTWELVRHAKRLLVVGDQFQAIYGFRGARDAMAQMHDAERLYLTQSFRFGPRIANAANLMLYWHGEPKRVVGAGPTLGTLSVDREKPYAEIGRTNMAVLESAFAALEQKHRLHFVGGVENYRLQIIEDGYRLFIGRQYEIKDRFIAKFSSLSALADYALEARDSEMALLAKIILAYQHRIPDLLRQLRARCVDSMRDAHRIFSTAHKSKGLEYPQAVMLDDFKDLVDGGKLIPKDEIDPQEVNLMYVAATRAMEGLQLSAQYREYWDHMKRLWRAERNAVAA